MRCQKKECGQPVYFIRHNGGSVWVDPPLGPPWHKHRCYYDDDQAEPDWLTYLRKQTAGQSGSRNVVGWVVKTKWVKQNTHGPTRILLAIDGGQVRRCVAIRCSSTATYHLDTLVIVDIENERVISSRFDTFPLLKIGVIPIELGLPSDWINT
jgi:hypothetical protein